MTLTMDQVVTDLCVMLMTIMFCKKCKQAVWATCYLSSNQNPPHTYTPLLSPLCPSPILSAPFI